jgi:hypothetical protein
MAGSGGWIVGIARDEGVRDVDADGEGVTVAEGVYGIGALCAISSLARRLVEQEGDYVEHELGGGNSNQSKEEY